MVRNKHWKVRFQCLFCLFIYTLYFTIYVGAINIDYRMLEKNDSPSPDICLIHGSNGLSEEEDFLKVTPRITIEGLKESRGVSFFA